MCDDGGGERRERVSQFSTAVLMARAARCKAIMDVAALGASGLTVGVHLYFYSGM